MRYFGRLAGAVAALAMLLAPAAPARAFVTFESGQVRPMALSPDGTHLFVCNTPDNRLEVFEVGAGGLTHVTSVPVGLEPVAVAARSDDEVWVVNFLSDSVSVVDVSDLDAPRVTRSLTVGDEPRDIVFGGPAFDRAFITTAHRGQNAPFDPQFTTAGVPRADVWVFDANNLGSSFGGDEVTILHLFGDTPRPLAVSADGTRVYAGVFESGNQTTALGEGVVPNYAYPLGSPPAMALPPPYTNYAGVVRPEVGLIVKWDGTKWTDELGRDWTSSVQFSLPDYDVFAIDATTNPPTQVAGPLGSIAHVGTTLMNMAINPADGKLFVTNLEAFNEVRFEGEGNFTGLPTVRGHLVESRISVVDPTTGTVDTRNLNKHINYATDPYDPVPNTISEKSLAFPIQMAFNSAGTRMYVAALGSSKVGVFTPSQVEADSFVPDTANQIELTGGGPTGVVLDEANGRLYVLTRFDNSVSVVNTAINVESDHIALHNPEPANVVEGRPFLYNARFTSSRGDQACASCHIFGDFDSLAWDLGNPDEDVVHNPQDFILKLGNADFHPMKGPMTTQSLRGMDNEGPMHWRGDRTGGNDVPSSSQPNTGNYDEQAGFKKFNGAFVSLLGRDSQLSAGDMQKFTDFILDVMYPPNPVRNLDNSLTADQAAGQNIFFNRFPIDTVQSCNGCHVTTRTGNQLFGVEHPGFFGTDGRSTFENETQHFKVAHLRNLYQKVGMFGNSAEAFVNPGDNGFKGDQVRGFGFLHDGSVDTVFRFFQATVFNHQNGPMPLPNGGFTVDAAGDAERRQMEQFVLAFDSNHRPIVGQQATLSPTSGADASTRVDLILDRADNNECDVVVKGVVGGEERGWVYAGSGSFQSDRASDGAVAEATLRALAGTAGQELTFTAVPVGEGRRIGVDRDEDGYADADEVEVGADPADAGDTPCATTTASFAFTKAAVKEKGGKLQLKADVTLTGPYAGGILGLVATDSDGTIFSGGVPDGAMVLNNSGSQYKFKAAKGATGVVKAAVKSLSGTNQYRVTMKVMGGWTPPGADETTATTTVELRLVDECFDGAATKVN